MNKKYLLGITVASAISVGALAGCGNKADTEQKNESPVVAETEAETETETETAAEAETVDVAENTTETDDAIVEDTSFGLKDFEGFYYYTGTEEIEDYEVTYTYGYQFNGDGTGKSYVQDFIDFTWNETEIHYGSNTETYTMEPGKLIVGGMEFKKLDGNFITPNPCNVDIDNIDNGIYHAYIAGSDIKEDDGKTTIWTEVSTEETFDIVDINRMTEGDAIFIKNQLFIVNSIEKTPSGIINVNGGIENGGTALRPEDESNCYVYVGMDMEKSYTRQGVTTLTVSDDVKLIDRSNPDDEKEYTGSDAIAALKELTSEFPLTFDNCTIMVENGEIVEINRLFTP